MKSPTVQNVKVEDMKMDHASICFETNIGGDEGGYVGIYVAGNKVTLRFYHPLCTDDTVDIEITREELVNLNWTCASAIQALE